jgi:hypothetical protein
MTSSTHSQLHRRFRSLLIALVILLGSGIAAAADPAAARAQLEIGYALKEQGHFDEALPHLLESLRLDPQLKTLTNLADCEEHLGKLVDAQQHWIQARDRAAVEQNDRLKESVEAKLTALESRMPRLTIKLAPGAPSATEIVRDGTILGAISVGTPLPTNTGAHVIVARGPGLAERSFTVTLHEGEQQELVVQPGDPLPAAAAGPSTEPKSEVASGASWSNMKTGSVVAGGVAVVGLGLGIGFGLSTGSHWSTAQKECGTGCSASSAARSERSTALTDATVADVSFVVAGVALAAGVVLWLKAPRHPEASPPAPAVGVVPLATRGGSGVAVLATF